MRLQWVLQNSNCGFTVHLLHDSLSATAAAATVTATVDMAEFLELEAQDAVRMPWNVLPETKAEFAQCVIPISAIYTPLKPLPPSTPLVPYSPLCCRNCRSVLNPFSIVDLSTVSSKLWICCFCLQRNHFPMEYQSFSESNLPAKLFPQYTTIEYEDQNAHAGAAFVTASLVDPTMVNCKSHLTILFQRLSVIISDSVLFYGVYRITRKIYPKQRYLIWVLVIGAPRLIIVDHLHFQYNGFLLGILLLSLAALEEGKDLMGRFFFAVLLCFKHLFAVAAPVYFVYLLTHYCKGGLVKGFERLVLMGSVVVTVFAAAYGPFLYYGQVFLLPHHTVMDTFIVLGVFGILLSRTC